MIINKSTEIFDKIVSKLGIKLPKGLLKLMDWILVDNIVQSWCYLGDTNLTLPIRFASQPNINLKKYKASNYSPVSLTCVLCKCMEHIVANR